MRKHIKPSLSLLLVLAFIIGLIPINIRAVPGEAATTSTTGVTVGDVKNIVQTIDNTDTLNEFCQRILTGSLTLEWPQPQNFVDIVVIQDFSGSLKGSIANVGKAIEKIASNLNMGTDIDGKSPKDRVMFVAYQGGEGYVNINGGIPTYPNDNRVPLYGYGDSVYNYAYKVEASDLFVSRNNISSYITSNYSADKANGGTPTVDGMRLAQTQYAAKTPTNLNYNNKQYTINGKNRNRQTIYILITDGVANTSKYSNLPDESKKLLRLYTSDNNPLNSPYIPGGRSFTDNTQWKNLNYYYYLNKNSWYRASDNTNPSKYRQSLKDDRLVKDLNGNYYYDYVKDGSDFYLKTPNYFPGTLEKSYLWADTRNNDGSIVGGYGTVHRKESYRVMLDAMNRISSEIKATGGLGKTDATVVSAFWEDINQLAVAGVYGNGWYNMRDTVIAGMKSVATGNYFTSSGDMTTFTDNLVSVFKEANQNKLQEIEIDFAKGVVPTINDVTLTGPDGKIIPLSSSTGEVRVSGSKLFINMNNRPGGKYKVNYKASETEFMPSLYRAIEETIFRFDTKDYKMSEVQPEELKKLTIEANPKTDCDLNVRKYVTLNKEDYNNNADYRNLPMRRQEFYFDTTYTFTGAVQEVNDSLVLRDMIEKNLQVLDVFLVAKNTTAMADAVSSPTPDKNLIAEWGDSVPGSSYNPITVQTQTDGRTLITYNLPQQKKTASNGTVMNFGGYEGKEYVLVVKVKVKDSVSEESIDALINTPDLNDNTKSLGFNNISEIVADSKSIPSNNVKAVPPLIKRPDLNKFISRIFPNGGTDEWNSYSVNIDSSKEKYRYKIEASMPSDTTSYNQFIVTDNLKPYLQYDASSLKSYYITAKNETVQLQDKTATYTSAIDSNNKLTFAMKDSGNTQAPFEAMAGGKLVFEFDVTIKEGTDISQLFNAADSRYEISNSSSFTLNNDPEIKPSNTVYAIIPVPNVTLKKFGTSEGADKTRLPLAGAEFILTDSKGVSRPVLVTDSEGNITIDSLLPGETYTLREIKTSPDYVLDETPWTIKVNMNNTITITGGPTDKRANNTIISSGNYSISVDNYTPQVPVPVKTLKGKLDEGNTFIPAPFESPYLLKNNGETVTYRISVPIGSTKGYNTFEIRDTFDPYLDIDMKSARSYMIKNGSETPVQGEFVLGESNTIIWRKNTNFSEIENAVLVIEVDSKVKPGKYKEIFNDTADENHSNGKIANKAFVVLNGGKPEPTKETFIQLSRGEVSIRKSVLPKGASEEIPLPEGLSASFQLYKLREPTPDDPNPTADPEKDTFVQDGMAVIEGNETETVEIFDTGSYYFVETSSPSGYVAAPYPIPAEMFNLPSSEIKTVAGTYDVVNKEADTPTITKKIRKAAGEGQIPDVYTIDDLEIDIGTVWQYALDTKIPDPLDPEYDYKISDSIPSILEILDSQVYLIDEEGNSTFSPELQDKMLRNYVFGNPNNIEITILKDEIKALEIKGKTIRIELTVRVRKGENLLTSGLLTDGLLTNTAYLEFGGQVFSDPVSVKPVILRNFEFIKLLGQTPLPGATFRLYKYNTVNNITEDPVTDPFTGEVVKSTSDDKGYVSFKNIRAGEYIMKETPPEGTYPVFGDIRVTVAGASVPDKDPSAIIFRAVGGSLLSDTEVHNNTQVTISGVKHWNDYDNQYNNRPQSIDVTLYRSVAGSTALTKIATKRITAPWTYTFRDEQGLLELPKYDQNGNEYVYSVREEQVTAYTSTQGPGQYDITNTLDKVPFAIVKKNQAGEVLPGRKFQLRNENGNVREITTDNNGIIYMDDLTKAKSYTLTEIFEQNDIYLGLNPDFIITVDIFGNISAVNTAGKLNLINVPVDLDGNPDTQDQAFEIVNIKRESPVKNVGPKTPANNPQGEEFDIEGFGRDYRFTYSVTQPAMDLTDVKSFVFKDTVADGLAVDVGSGRVYAVDSDGKETEVTDIFYKTIENVDNNIGRTKVFTSGTDHDGYRNLSGKTLRFTFDAYIAVNPDEFIKKHPSLTVPNQGYIILNNNPLTTYETNSVDVSTDLINVRFPKKVEGRDNEGNKITKDIPDGLFAEFALFDAVSGREIKRARTDSNGFVSAANIAPGSYFLRETASPEGFGTIDDIYFLVKRNQETKKLEIVILTGKDGEPTGEVYTGADPVTGFVTSGMIEDPIPELPTLNKQIKGKDNELIPENPETEEKENKDYILQEWNGEFDYLMDIRIPEDTSEIDSISFEDPFPTYLAILEESASVTYGTGEGSEFISDEPQPLYEVPLYAGFWPQDNSYKITYSISDKGIIDSHAGKTIRLSVRAKIADEYKNKYSMVLTNGGIINTATLTVNDQYPVKSEAKLTPPELYGVKLIKKSVNGKPLLNAVFALSQYKDEKGNPEGPELPEGLPTQYVTGTDGGFTIDARLMPGKYLLTEEFTPTAWVDENGVRHPANYSADYTQYILEILPPEEGTANGETVINLYGILLTVDENGNVTSSVTEEPLQSVKASKGTSELITVLNRRLVEVPIIKRWNDNKNSAKQRPEYITFILQRSIVNGLPDVLNPDTGELVPLPDDDADTPDTEFNDYAESSFNPEKPLYKVQLPVSSADSEKGHFSSDLEINFGTRNHLNILRYALDGRPYNYYVQETDSDGYKSAYSVGPMPRPDTDYSTETIIMTNTLNSSNFKIKKVDDSETPKTVEGAVFNLSYEENGSSIVRTLTSDKDGMLDFTDFIYPNKVYTLKEVSAPKGYLKTENVYTIVSDNEAELTFYIGYVDKDHHGTLLEDPEITVGKVKYNPDPEKPELELEKSEYTLTVVDIKTVTPTPEKKVEGKDTYALESLTKEFTYTVDVPVGSTEGYKSFGISDKINDLLVITGESDVTVTADGKDIKNLGTFEPQPLSGGQAIKFTMTSGFENIADRTVRLSFKAKVKDGVTLDQLLAYVTLNPEGIKNTAEVTVNDDPRPSNETFVVPEKPEDPTIVKTVNGNGEDSPYPLKSMDEVFSYRIEVPVPQNVLGYSSLKIEDTIASVIGTYGGIKLSTVDKDGVITPLKEGTDYDLIDTSNSHQPGEKGEISAEFVKAYDYTKIAGKTVVMEFDARFHEGVTAFDIAEYPENHVSNTAEIVLNNESKDKSTVNVYPPEKPVIEKKINSKDSAVITDLSKNVEYTVSASIPVNYTGKNKFVIKDQLKDVFDFERTEIRVTVDGSDPSDIKADFSNETGLISVTLDNAINQGIVQRYQGKTIVITISTEFDPAKDITPYLIEGKLQNTAEIIVDDKPETSDDADATIPQGEITLTKTGNGAALPGGTSATFDLYKVSGVVDGNGSIGDTQDINSGSHTTVNGKLTVTGLEPGMYYFIETQAPARFELDTTKRIFTVTSDEEGNVKVDFVTGFNENFTVDNVTKTVPEPVKTITYKNNAQLEHVDLSLFNDDFTYEVKVPVKNTAGWTEFRITDPVDSSLEVKTEDIKVEVHNSDGSDPVVYEFGNRLTFVNGVIEFRLSEEDLHLIDGKTVVLTFKANLKGTPGEFLAAHADSIVGNKAEINIGNTGIPTNNVTVTPPGTVPKPEKSIDGDISDTPLKLGEKSQKFFYDIRIPVPQNVIGYSSFTITDELENVLQTPDNLSDVTVYVNDIVNSSLKQFVSATVNPEGKQVITLSIDNATAEPKFDFKTLAGKTVRLSIRAGFKPGVTDEELKKYIVAPSAEVIVPNTADLKINDQVETSNQVNVTPPGNEPEVNKTVEISENDTTKETLNLKAKDQIFTYRVNVTVPSNVEGYKSIKLEDTLKDVLEVKKDSEGKDLVSVLLNDGTTYTGPLPAVNGNNVTLDITEGFTQYAGKTITLVIKAGIKADVTNEMIALNYGNSTIPNTAILTFNDSPKDSNEVGVVPPGIPPVPKKDVNAQTSVDLKEIGEEFTYNVRFAVPTNITGFDKLTMTDTLEKVLETEKGRITVYVDDIKDEKLTDEINVKPQTDTEGQKITLTINKGFASALFGNTFEGLAGKTVRVEIKANIRNGADLSGYTNRSVPNEASLTLNDAPVNEENTTPPVFVTPPRGSVILTKLASGEKLKGEETATFELYRQLGEKPDMDADMKIRLSGTEENPVFTATVNSQNNSVTVQSLEPGNYYFIETAAPAGYVLDSNPIGFTVKADENTPVVLYFSNRLPSETVPKKTVSDSDEKDARSVLLTSLDEIFTYRVEVPVDSTEGWTGFTLTDPADQLIEIPRDTVKVEIVNGETTEETYTLEDIKNADVFTMENNLITFSFTQLDKVKALAGRKVILTFSASIKDMAAYMAAHPDAVSENTASIDTGNGSVPSNTVTVTPPGEKPAIEKKVKGSTEGINDIPSDETLLQTLDESFTFLMNVKVPLNTRDVTKIQLQDTFSPIFKIGNEDTITVEVKNSDGSLNEELTERINSLQNIKTVDGQKVMLYISGPEANSYRDKTITLSVPAVIDSSKTLADYMVAGRIKNTAELYFNNDPKPETDDASVVPPPEESVPVKDVNGKGSEKLETLNEKFTYHVGVKIPADTTNLTMFKLTDDLEDIFTVDTDNLTVKVNGIPDSSLKLEITADGTNVVTLTLTKEQAEKYKGKYIEMTIVARIKEGITRAELDGYINEGNPEGAIPNVATLQLTDNSDEVKVTDNVPVTPPTETPVPVKTVNDKPAEALGAMDQLFTYKIRTQVPKNVADYEKITIRDDLEDVLEVVNAKIFVNGVENTSYVPSVDKDTSLVTMEITEGIQDLKGTNLDLVIEARIREGADLSGYANQTVPNKGSIVINDSPDRTEETNVVPVTPPGNPPPVIKDVNGQHELSLDTLNQTFNYNVKTVIPQNTTGYQKITISDDLEDVLEVTGTEVEVNGVVDKNLKAAVNSETGLVTLDITEGFDKLAGKLINLKIFARIRKDADLSGYSATGEIPNQAFLVLNDDQNRKTETDIVPVKPPTETPSEDKPTLTKDADGYSGDTPLQLGKLDQVFTYHVGSWIPQDISKFTKFVISDNLEDILVTGKDDITVKVNGTDASELNGFVRILEPVTRDDETVDINNIVLEIPTEILKSYTGKYLELSIRAHINPEADLNGYTDSNIPNTAHLSFNGEPDMTAGALVKPPSGDVPSVEKTVSHVNGDGTLSGTTKQMLVLKAADEVHQYRVDVRIPQNVTGFQSVGIMDTIDPAMSVVGEPVIFVDGKADGAIGKPVVSESNPREVSFTLTEGFEKYAGKTLTLVINAKITNLALLENAVEYPNMEVPNTGHLIFNGKDQPSNTVAVTPPSDEPTIEKTVKSNDQNETPNVLGLETRETNFTYRVKVDVPEGTTGFKNITVSDTLDESLIGDGYGVVIESENGPVLDTDLAGKVTTDGKTFGLEITEGFEKYAGKKIVLEIYVHIDPAYDLSKKFAQLIPNKADLNFNGKDKPSNYVWVVPPTPPVTPTPDTPSIDLIKTADTELITEVGQKVIYTFSVTNTGNTELTDVILTDTMNGTDTNIILIRDGVEITSLKPGETALGTMEYTATAEDMGKTLVHNDAAVTGTPPQGPPVEDKDTHDIPTANTPSIDLDKRADKLLVTAEGEIVTYELVITNTGNVTLTNVTLTDAMLGGNIELSTTTLAPGESTSVTVPHAVTSEEFRMREIRNDASVVGTPPIGTDVTDTDYWTVIPKTEIFGEYPIIKVDMMDNHPLAGAEFALVNPKNETVSSGITDAEGKITFSKIPVGVYYLVETKAPKGYLQNEARMKVEVLPDGSVTTEGKPGGAVVTNVRETPEEGTIILHKMDSSDRRKSLAGAKFELWYKPAAGTEVIPETTAAPETPLNPENSQDTEKFNELSAKRDSLYEEANAKFEEYSQLKVEIEGETAAANAETQPDGETITDNNVEQKIEKMHELGESVETLKEELDATDAQLQNLSEKMVQNAATSEPQISEDATMAAQALPNDGYQKIKNGELDYFITDEAGMIILGGLPDGDYYFLEVEAPEGYTIRHDRYDFIMKDAHSNAVMIDVYNDPTPGTPPEYTDIPVVKVWKDGPEPRPDIMVALINNKTNEVVRQNVIKSGETGTIFEGLPKLDSSGNPIEYGVFEYTVKGYDSVIEVNGEGTGFVITNTYNPGTPGTPATIMKVVNKKWIGGPEPKPAVTFELYGNGVYLTEAVLEPGRGYLIFADLPVRDSNGIIDYKIVEQPVPVYEQISEGKGFIVNKYIETPPGGNTSVTVTKTWLNNDLSAYTGDKPSITLRLNRRNADGTTDEVDTEVFDNGKTTHTWNDLPTIDSNGRPITYFIKEDTVKGYSSVITTGDGFNFSVINLKDCVPPVKTPCTTCVTIKPGITPPSLTPGVPKPSSPSVVGGGGGGGIGSSSNTGKGGNLPGTGNTTSAIPIVGGLIALAGGLFFLMKKGKRNKS